MTSFDLIAYGTVSVAAIVAGLAIIPNPFRQSVRDTLSIFLEGLLSSATTELQRAENRLKVLEKELSNNQRIASDMRGSVNHNKNLLNTRKAELKKAEDDLQLAIDQKLGKNVEDDCIDAIGAAEEAVHVQALVVEDFQKSADTVRLAIAKAAKEVQALGRTVQSKAARDTATKVLSSAADILQATKEMGKATSEIGRDLDKIDEKYEQAKTRLEDSQGSKTERKLEEARANKQREDIRKRMEERRAAEGK